MDVLYFILQSCYSAISDTGYSNFYLITTQDLETPNFLFSGLTGQITFSSDADVKVGFDVLPDESSIIIQGGEQPVTIPISVTKLYLKGVSGNGSLQIVSQNLGTGKSDNEIRLEDRMNRKI
jgi:hypothetical protein